MTSAVGGGEGSQKEDKRNEVALIKYTENI